MSQKQRMKLSTHLGFNPRPPKRTLCLDSTDFFARLFTSFNPRPPKRTLCLDHFGAEFAGKTEFQSTSSEEDVVSL